MKHGKFAEFAAPPQGGCSQAINGQGYEALVMTISRNSQFLVFWQPKAIQ